MQRKSVGGSISCTSSLFVMSGFKRTSGCGSPTARLSSDSWGIGTKLEEAEAARSLNGTCPALKLLRQESRRAQRLPSRRDTAVSLSCRTRNSAKSACKRARTSAFIGCPRSIKPPSNILSTIFLSRDCRILCTRPIAASFMGSTVSSELPTLARGGVKAATAERSKARNSSPPPSMAAGNLLSRSTTQSWRAPSSTTAQRLASCWKRRAASSFGTTFSGGNADKSSRQTSRSSSPSSSLAKYSRARTSTNRTAKQSLGGSPALLGAFRAL
mmetsp:Transcript_166892/g.530669  ORF Transcript_166892/g.530669 Transcript_166892/m.530669 type:complete len:271 (-) Transcript_166892:398-1210(-)